MLSLCPRLSHLLGALSNTQAADSCGVSPVLSGDAGLCKGIGALLSVVLVLNRVLLFNLRPIQRCPLSSGFAAA